MVNGAKNKIVFINQVTGYLMKDLINVFCREFDEVALIAGSISKTGESLNPKVQLSKIAPYNKSGSWQRLLSWLWATIQIIFLINIKYRGFHLFITSNPPTLAFLPLFSKNKYSILIYDVYPDGLVAGEFIPESSWITKVWKKQNKRYFKKALNIYTLTDSMAETMTQYMPRERIQVIAPWSLFSGGLHMNKEDNLFIKKYDLQGFLLVMYSGNIGFGHNVKSLIEVAKLLKNKNDIKFVIIGEGWNKKLIGKYISDFDLKNCLLLPFQPHEMFRYSLPAADIGVVSIVEAGAKICAPSKIYNMINLEIPLLCIAEPGTELANLIDDCKIGKVCRYDNYEAMAEFILLLKDNPDLRKSYKNNLKNCSMNFTTANADKYLTNFKAN